jgi:DNA-directed RNA polymerase specialized sigma subunit
MRNCLKCPHKIALEEGRLADVPWNETPCAKCVWIEDTFFSIPYDEAEDDDGLPLIPSSVLRSQVDAYRRENISSESTLAQSLPVDVLNELVNRMLSLPPEQRDVVSYRFQGKTYKEIGQIMGVSSQCSEMRHKIAMRNFPELKALFPVKTAKRKRHLAKSAA